MSIPILAKFLTVYKPSPTFRDTTHLIHLFSVLISFAVLRWLVMMNYRAVGALLVTGKNPLRLKFSCVPDIYYYKWSMLFGGLDETCRPHAAPWDFFQLWDMFEVTLCKIWWVCSPCDWVNQVPDWCESHGEIAYIGWQNPLGNRVFTGWRQRA